MMAHHLDHHPCRVNMARAFTVALLLSAVISTVECFSEKPVRSTPADQQWAPRDQAAQRDSFELSEDGLGPSQWLMDSVSVGSAPLRVKRLRDDYQVEKLSDRPHLYLLKEFVPKAVCQAIIKQAETMHTMVAAETNETKGARPHCNVTWLDNDDHMVRDLAQSAGNLLLSETARTSANAGCEQLQVLHYAQDGEFVLHHDEVSRVLTIIYYLNGVAGTWFPLAASHVVRFENREQAMEACRELAPGRDGILITGDSTIHSSSESIVSIQAGDAVAFYNYYTNDQGRDAPDWHTIHAGLPVASGEQKWIANHWLHSPQLFVSPTFARNRSDKESDLNVRGGS